MALTDKPIEWENGIFYREQGRESRHLWNAPLQNSKQYDKVMEYLQQFKKDNNMLFASQENFWRGFLGL